VSTLILVNGDDDFLKERVALDEAAMVLTPNVTQFTFPEDMDRYLEFLDIRPMSNVQNVTIIWNASNVPNILDDGVTIVVASKGKLLNNNEAKRVVDVKKPKSYNNGIEYVNWILNEGERLRIDLSRVASALFVNCGMDLRKICSEIRKLEALSDSSDAVDSSMARRVMCFSADLTPKNIVDAICDGHPAKALAFYDKLQERRCETGWIIAYMQSHVLQHLRTKMLLEQKTPQDQIPVALGVHPWVFKNTIFPRLGLWDTFSLQKSLATLCDLDVLHKRGVDVSCWGLEPEIIRLSEEAKHNDTSRGTRLTL
jgi:DNA polymerase III delta subunit